jgi:hypothetical protein
MIDQILTATDQDDLAEAIERVEAEEIRKVRTRGITKSSTNGPVDPEKTWR